MGQKKYYILFCYDISNNNKRNKIYRMMKKYTFPVQKSVFEAVIDDKIVGQIIYKASKILDYRTDSLRIYKFQNLTNISIQNLGIDKNSPFENDSNVIIK